jgi:hypothetical protein
MMALVILKQRLFQQNAIQYVWITEYKAVQ